YFVAPLAGRSALGATLIAVAFALAFIIITASSNWIRIIATIGLSAIIFVVGVAIIWGPSSWLGFTPEAAITMIRPTSDNPEPQPGCVQIIFSGALPDGKVYIVGNREKENPRYYFQGQVYQDPTSHNWISNIQIGQNGKIDGGHIFYIYIYLVS